MKLEEAIEKLKETQDSYLKDELDLAIETVLQALGNSIPKEKLKEKLIKYFDIGTNGCIAYNLTRVKEARQYGTLTIDDFVEFDEETIDDIVDYILRR